MVHQGKKPSKIRIERFNVMLPKHQEVKHGESGYLHARDKTGCLLLLTPFSHKKKGAAGVVST